MIVASMEDVIKRYGNVQALDHVSLIIQKGLSCPPR